MEEKAHTRTSLVSRLPKYGTKPVGSPLPPVPNRTAPHFSGNAQIIDKNFSKHNGAPRLSSFAFNWRKSNKFPLGDRIGNEYNSGQDPSERVTGSEKCPQSEGSVGQEQVRTSSKTTFSKTVKQDNMFVSPAEELNQKCLSGLSNSKYAKSSLLNRSSYSGFNTPKQQLNGICGSQSMLGLQRIRGNHFVTRSSSRESLARSTDHVPPASDKMVRSQSFSHSLQSSLLPPTSLTRSHSFNRAVDLTRPCQNQHLALRPPQRSNLLLRSARQLDVPNGNEPSRYEFPRSLASSAPPHIKKQPLLNGSGDASSLRFRSGRPSLLKPVSHHLGRKIPVDGSARKEPANSLMEDLIPTEAKRDADVIETQSNNFVESSCRMCTDGDVDEISISSLSSSEKNDLSEDFSDDFIDLEDPSRTLLAQEEKVPAEKLEDRNGIPPHQLLSFQENEKLNYNNEEWLHIHVSEIDDKNETAKLPPGNNEISSEMDYRAGSSFELSPSDSSDGTYMWDEEGLEPIGSVHLCGSYDSSEMNSIDILNNLESCDLEDDDLMLDVDLPEDTPCDNEEYDNMNRYDRPDRNIRQQKAEGLWKRTPQRWNTQDHYHLSPTEHYSHIRNDLNRSCNYVDSPPVNHLEGYGASGLYPPLRSFPANTVVLDEMTLRHMVQDCTAVKTQLLKMKRILHQNDENMSLHNITPPVPSSPEELDPEPTYKIDELLSEITRLNDDLKKKDETIQELERRLAVRCGCHKASKVPEATTCGFADKFTQTSWRRNAPQVLQPSSHLPRSADLSQGKLAKASLTVARSEPPPQDQPEHVGHEDGNAALGSGTDSGREPSTLNTQRNDDNSLANAHSTRNATVREKAKDVAGRKLNASQPLAPSAQLNAQDGQARPALKSHSSRPNQASPPKMSRALRAPKQTVPVPPPATSSRDSFVPPLSSQAQSQSASNLSLPSSRNQRASKLRPPAISSRPKQRTTPQTVSAPEQPRFQAGPTKPLAPTKEAPQNRDPALRPGEGLTLHRLSRLPKPKT
ncbi:PREDICTED: serine-rich coiled-coil domain-containing protein 2 isoform X1 [Thamnophis sirtalis]|uniref:Serine-rich coiled-coil domain-containing protein 2 isoform X1 n=1 Tax=Thamnophis sirtalis TaxID=35019 RepID=A0A6I9YPQ0_9SAUR|nr:PREDICTED: serine-rich coiled-coil domain-containing protein 2 isoform X1 [Thamnophis sirtalis]XP_013926489.1 PREDICTED: serine-rich coiled-coil domain-containing protein 2 isoform X1 [Thamnophis sirtalis]